MITFNEYIDKVNNEFKDSRIKNKVQIFFRNITANYQID